MQLVVVMNGLLARGILDTTSMWPRTLIGVEEELVVLLNGPRVRLSPLAAVRDHILVQLHLILLETEQLIVGVVRQGCVVIELAVG